MGERFDPYRKLLDHSYPLEFQVDARHRYTDDPLAEKYEIREVDRSKYFVFILTAFRTSMAFDESKLFQQVLISLQFKEDTLDQLSRVGYFYLSLTVSGFLVVAFILILLTLPDVRRALLGNLFGSSVEVKEESRKN